MGTPRQGLERLREAAASGSLERLCDRLGVEILVVFGSAVRDDLDQAPADLDVVVRLRDNAPADPVDVTNALIDLTGHSHVDVLDLRVAGVVARARALGPGSEPLFEAESGTVARAQMAALSYAMETAPLRRWDLEILARR